MGLKLAGFGGQYRPFDRSNIVFPLKAAFIKGNGHDDIVNQALIGFKNEMITREVDCKITVLDVPEAVEMPLLAQRVARQGDVDVVVRAGLVVDGGIYRHEFVAQTVVSGLMDVQLATDVPVFSVSFTPPPFQSQAEFNAFYSQHFI